MQIMNRRDFIKYTGVMGASCFMLLQSMRSDIDIGAGKQN